MPVAFLSGDETAAYGRYTAVPSQAELDNVFFLDDEDRKLVGRHRGPHMKLAFALQLVTVRYVGLFLKDPLDMPPAVVEFVAAQLEIADPPCVKRYTERAKAPCDHAREIQRAYRLRDFAAAEGELRAWVAARSWTSGDGPKTISVTRYGGCGNTARAIDLAIGERTEGPLFLAGDGRRLDRHGAGRIVRRVTRRAGIDKKVSPHTLRHAFITAALDAGVPLRDVQEAASHADPRTTMHYDRARTSLDRHATYIVAAFITAREPFVRCGYRHAQERLLSRVGSVFLRW